MPDRLELTKNSQFYTPKVEIIDEVIEDILNEASSNIDEDAGFIIDVFRQEKSVEEHELNYIYSIKVFPSVRPVYFIDEALEDKIHAYIILIEIDGYLAVLKKSCSSITEKIKEYFSLVGSSELGKTFGDNAEYQKLALRNMTISDKALRSRSYEAADLKGLLSTHAAGRSIPFYLKIRQGSSIKSISGTGRVVESSQRKSVDDIAVWIKSQIQLLESASENEFLDSFAKKVELQEVLSECEPNAILIESSLLYERIKSDSLPLKYRSKKGSNILVSERVTNKLFSELEKVYEIDSEDKVIGREGCSKIRRNEKTLTISSKMLTKFRVIENGKDIPLQKYIVKNGFYSITFTDPKYMYFMGACFEDQSGVSEINSILDILQPQANMGGVTSEKGTFSTTHTNFDVDSMFYLVEDAHKNDDYIFCDDLGIEWADHITLNLSESCISFVHSKHGSPTTSASKLHDVVGQGIKNLGNMFFTHQQLLERVNGKFSDLYSNGSVNTQITRTRKGSAASIGGDLENLLKDYQLHRKCILCCSFISKSSITAEFSKIQNNQSVPGHITQLLWIISSFAHAARDMHAIPIIYCSP
ncbi:hypothetical protein FIU88_02630 [Halomonas sp. THAF12]|uniref:hypothetical protein n=1 Tax=Halomonas sp. THAF12 TaxID=2587849 RepID=UPI00126798B5|nr:hypothetical protein [Halomonas sp. THAF12]QFT83861.1 hypothetical protein FIU88_02630 [Halomonas sp. THAF12]